MRLELGFWADRWFFFGASVGKLDDSTVLFTPFLCAKWLADTSDFYFLSAQGALSKSITNPCENLNDLIVVRSWVQSNNPWPAFLLLTDYPTRSSHWEYLSIPTLLLYENIIIALFMYENGIYSTSISDISLMIKSMTKLFATVCKNPPITHHIQSFQDGLHCHYKIALKTAKK